MTEVRMAKRIAPGGAQEARGEIRALCPSTEFRTSRFQGAVTCRPGRIVKLW
jgi:hypothetical protein